MGYHYCSDGTNFLGSIAGDRMNWILGGAVFVVAYLFYVLTIEFKMSKIDDDVLEPDADAHNDPNIWEYSFWRERVNKRKMRAVVRWAGVSVVVMAVAIFLAAGGNSVKALKLTTPTPTQTNTPENSATPSTTPTRRATSTPQATLTASLTPTPSQSATPKVIYQPGATVPVLVTRISYVEVTRVIVRTSVVIYTTTPLPTYTAFPTYTPYPTYTAFPTLEPSPTMTPTETATPTIVSYP